MKTIRTAISRSKVLTILIGVIFLTIAGSTKAYGKKPIDITYSSVEEGWEGEGSDVGAGEFAEYCDNRRITGNIYPSIDTLWPPNHKMVAVEIDTSELAMNNPDTQVSITSIDIMEPSKKTGENIYNANNFNSDVNFNENGLSVNLRSERAGASTERTYIITVTATDCSGSYNFTAEVTVPHDSRADANSGTSGEGEIDEGNILLMNLGFISKFSDNFATNTAGNYTWNTRASGVGYFWNPAGYMYLDGTHSGGYCCWVPAHVQAEKTVNIPSSGYAKIDFDLVGDGAGQSRIIFQLKEDDNNMYMFKVTDDSYGSSGYTQGVTKRIGGVNTDYYNGPGTVALGGTERGNSVDAINEHVVMEVWWSPTNLRLAVNGTTIKDLRTTDTTALNPTLFVFRSYRLNINWSSVDIYELKAEDASVEHNHADTSYMSHLSSVAGGFGPEVFFHNGLKIPDSDTLDVIGNELTLSIWVKPSWDEATNRSHYLFDKRGGSQGNNYNSYRFFFYAGIDAWRFRLTTDTGTSNCDTAGITVEPNVWQHLVARYDGVNQSIWIDGIKMAECSQSGNILGNLHDLYIGSHMKGWGAFKGVMDEPTIWNRALSDQEIMDISQ